VIVQLCLGIQNRNKICEITVGPVVWVFRTTVTTDLISAGEVALTAAKKSSAMAATVSIIAAAAAVE